MKRREFLPLKIKKGIAEICSYGKKAQEGQAELAVGMFAVLFLTVFVYALLRVDAYRTSAQYLEDALAASNLASAIIDVQEYGVSHKIFISEPRAAYGRYCAALKGNLNLNEEWLCPNSRLIAGKVEVADYIVYNCADEKVYAYRVDASGIRESWQGTAGILKAPNGVPVVATGVYSEITYPVEGIYGGTLTARMGKLVDIVANEAKTDMEE